MSSDWIEYAGMERIGNNNSKMRSLQHLVQIISSFSVFSSFLLIGVRLIAT